MPLIIDLIHMLEAERLILVYSTRGSTRLVYRRGGGRDQSAGQRPTRRATAPVGVARANRPTRTRGPLATPLAPASLPVA